MEEVGWGLRMADVFLVGLIWACEVGFGLFVVGFAAVLKGFGDGLGLPGLDVVGFGPEDLVVVFPGVGLGPLGLVGEGKAAAGFVAVGFGLLVVLSVGLGVTGFIFPHDGLVCVMDRGGGVEECLGLNPATLSLTTTGTFTGFQRKLVGAGVKVRLGDIV